jgi:hypothetical protein
MSSDTVLQIFIYLQIFAAGVVAAFLARYAYDHYKAPARSEHHQELPPNITVDLPHDVRERLTQASEKQFQDILGQSAGKLQQDLGVTTGHINNLVLRLASEIVSKELERYAQDLTKLHEQAETNMGGISQEVAKHEADVKAKITQELETEKQRLLKQIDTKLADAVGSFLVSALGNNVDLGSQNAYLAQLLEEHKDEFKKEVAADA